MNSLYYNKDYDVCKAGNVEVYAKLSSATNDSVSVEIEGPRRGIVGNILLNHTEDMDKCTGTWKPKDAGFYKLHYRGKIQDMYTDHPDSDDKDDLSVSGYNASLTVLKVDIEQDVTNTCWRQSLASLNLTADSYAGPRGIEWRVSPATGLDVVSSIATNFVFCPSNSLSGEYVVKATSQLLPSCYDTCTVRVIKIDTIKFQRR